MNACPTSRHDSLDDAARDLAGDPAHIRWAKGLARRTALKWPSLAEDIEAAALVGLCDAASRFDPARGLKFRTFATLRVWGEMNDLLRRERLRGYGRNVSYEGAPKVVSIGIDRREDGETNGPEIPSGELPPGWAAESLDAIEDRIRVLPAQHKQVFRLLYGDAGCLTMKRVGRKLGLCESRVSQIHTEGIEMLKEANGYHDAAGFPVVEDEDEEEAREVVGESDASNPSPTVEAPRKSRYRGVSWNRRIGRWTATVCVGGGGAKYAGTYDDETQAARAYDRKAAELLGDRARLNFPEDRTAGHSPSRTTLPAPVASPVDSPAVGMPALLPPVVPVAHASVPAVATPTLAASPPPTIDREIAAMSALVSALAGLDPKQAGRVLAWAGDRFGAGKEEVR